MLFGIVRSGDYLHDYTQASAIGKNINNYSKTNQIIFTGTYVDGEGIETEIRKEIPLQMDWYGKTETRIKQTSQSYYDLPNRVDEENEELNLTFNVETEETAEELILKRNVVEGTIPDLNGYSPLQVTCESSNAELEYDEETHKFVLIRSSEVDEQGNITKGISRNNIYKIKVTYPIESYEAINAETTSIALSIPIEEYYEGYNNQNSEFSNPYKSNVAKATIIATFSNPREERARIDIEVGKYVTEPTRRYYVSKNKPLRLYNEISSEEKDDIYDVRWYIYSGINGQSSGLTLKETPDNQSQISDTFVKTDASEESMENITTNVGIGFSNASNFLNDDGWIKVYDDETGILLVTFEKADWERYTTSNPYKYEIPVKHIRIETSETKAQSSLYIYNKKELDDEYIVSHYTREQFDELQYIKSNLSAKLGDVYSGTASQRAYYEAPYSIAQIKMNPEAEK